MTRWFVALSLTLVVAGCKGETKIQDNPETLSALTGCQDAIASKDAYIKELEARAGELERKAGQNDGVVVTIAGDTMTISGKGPNVRAGGSVTADKDLYESFVTQVQAARGAMQRCYQNALKKDSGLQMREVELNIQVRFTPAGKVSKAGFSPTISDSFDSCMGTIARRWQLKESPSGAIFEFPVNLTPQ